MKFNPTYLVYPGGMLMPERFSTSGDYRYGYNGMEMDNETSGNGNSYTTEFRQYDPRLMRWKSLDPLMAQFPWMSPYVAFNNNPVYFIDPLGLQGGPAREKYPDYLKEALGNKEQWAYSSAAYFDKRNGQVSFSYTDKLEGHGNTVFNSHHFNRVTSYYKENAKKEANNDKGWMQCVQSASMAVNKLYNLKGSDKIRTYTAMQDANNGEEGLMEALKQKGLTKGDKTFTAVDKNGAAIHNSKGVASSFNEDPLEWAKNQTEVNGVGIFLVAALDGYHSLTLIVDRRGNDVTYRLLDQHGNRSTGSDRDFDRLKAHTKEEVQQQLLQMAIDWTFASYKNSNYRFVELKRD